MFIDIDCSLRTYAEAATVRLGYLYPELNFICSDGGVEVSGLLPENTTLLKRDVLHSIYREKIYNDTLPMRTAFLNAVTRK